MLQGPNLVVQEVLTSGGWVNMQLHVVLFMDRNRRLYIRL